MTPAVAPVKNPDFTWPASVRGAVSVTFDDGRRSQIEEGVPIFERFGVHATFYVVFANVLPLKDAWGRAAERGQEIGAHTLTHPCSGNFAFSTSLSSPLEDMTLEAMEQEILGSNAQLERLFGVKPVSFSYPCGHKFVGRGETLQSYVPLVARHYLTGRGWNDEYFNAPDRCDLAQLGGVELDGFTFDKVQPQIEEAARTGNWLVLAGHDIGAGSRRQLTRTATLEALCEYCTDPANGIWIDTVGAIGKYVYDKRGF